MKRDRCEAERGVSTVQLHGMQHIGRLGLAIGLPLKETTHCDEMVRGWDEMGWMRWMNSILQPHVKSYRIIAVSNTSEENIVKQNRWSSVSTARHIHYSRRSRCQQTVDKSLGQKEVTEVIRSDLHFKAIHSLRSLLVGHAASIVQQDMKRQTQALKLIHTTLHRGQTGQIDLNNMDVIKMFFPSRFTPRVRMTSSAVESNPNEAILSI